MDRRIIKTKESIKKEFVNLLYKNNIIDISVSKICTNCQISRSTFYSHFNDIYSLLDEVEEDIIQYIKTDKLNIMDENALPDQIILSVFDWIIENRPLFASLLKSNSYSFWNKFEEEFKKVITNKLLQMYIIKDEVSSQQLDYIIKFIMAGYGEVYKSMILSENYQPYDGIRYLRMISDGILGGIIERKK